MSADHQCLDSVGGVDAKESRFIATVERLLTTPVLIPPPVTATTSGVDPSSLVEESKTMVAGATVDNNNPTTPTVAGAAGIAMMNGIPREQSPLPTSLGSEVSEQWQSFAVSVTDAAPSPSEEKKEERKIKVTIDDPHSAHLLSQSEGYQWLPGFHLLPLGRVTSPSLSADPSLS
jgi:hypothetical protein